MKFKKDSSFKNTVGALIGTIVVFFIFACPILELSKIILFRLARDEINLKDRIIEYIYLGMVISLPFGLIFSAIKGQCCNIRGLVNYIKDLLCCLPILILIIASIYTHMTSHEMELIPESCPSDYPYRLPITRTACLIRLINFITMWTFTTLLIILSIADCFGCYPRNEKGKTIEKQLSGFFPPERDDEKGNPQ